METVGFPFVDKILLSEMSHRIDNAINLKKIQFYEKLLRRVCSMYKISCDNTSDVLSSHDSLSITEMKEEKRKIEHRIASPRPSQQIINKLLNWNNINFEDDTATAFTDDEDENGSSSTIVRSLPLSVLPLRTSAIDNSKKMMMVNDDDSRDKEKEVDGSYAILSAAGIPVNINNGISGNESSSLNTEVSLSSMAPSQSSFLSNKKRKRCSKNNNGSGGSSGGGSGYGGSEESLPSSALSIASSDTSTFTTTTINEDEIHSTKLQKVNDVTASLKKNDYAPSTNFQNKARLEIKEVINFETHINVATNYDITKNMPTVYDQMDAFSTPESASVPLVQPDLSTTANGTENCDFVNVFAFNFPQSCKDVNEAAGASTDVNVLSIETPTSEMLPPPSPLSLTVDLCADNELAFLYDLDNISMCQSQQSIDIPVSTEMPSAAIPVTTAELPAAVVNDVNNMNLTKEPTSKSVDNFNVSWYVKHCLSQIKISPKDRWASFENSFGLGLLTFCKKKDTYIIPDGSTNIYPLTKDACKQLQKLNSGPFSILVAAQFYNVNMGRSIVIVYHNLRQTVYDEFTAIMNDNDYTISHMKQIDHTKGLSELQKVDKEYAIIVHSASLNSFLGFRPLYFRVFGVWGKASHKGKLYLKICCRDISDKLINCDKSDKLIDCGLAQILTSTNISKDLIDSSIKYVEATDNKVMGTVRVKFHEFNKEGVSEGKVVRKHEDTKMSTFLINRNLDGMCCISEILFDRTDIITYLPKKNNSN